jgi:hypothetical protein
MSAVIGFAKDLTGHPAGIEKGFEYAWLESLVEKACLTRIALGWNDVKRWPSGRLFGEHSEYRWQCLKDGRLHKVLLLEDLPLPYDFKGQVDLECIVEEDLILWGGWIDPQPNPMGGPYFYANEIPQVLVYPLDMKGPPKENEIPHLIIRRYREKNQDTGEFVRCVGFKMKAEDE